MAVVGVIGGGQLARMMIGPATALGVEVRVLAEAPDASARLAATAVGDYRDTATVLAFAADCDVVTFDHEHVPQEVLRALVAAGAADAATLRVFARGKLVFWTLRGPLAGDDLRAALGGHPWATLALAQPRTAPYGRAAEAVLRELGFLPAGGTRLVLGETVAQTAQFVESGAAEGGFVALAAVLSPRLAGRGHWREVPAELHAGVTLDHAAVLTRRGAARAEARAFLDFLAGQEAQATLRRFGYATPTP